MFLILSIFYVFIETWIRTAKFSLKILIRYEDIKKIQNEFPRGTIHRRSENQLTVNRWVGVKHKRTVFYLERSTHSEFTPFCLSEKYCV